MYLNMDLAGPIHAEFRLNSKARNIILNNFPTVVVDGVDCFSKLYAYSGGNVNTAPEASRVYKLFGTSAETLQEQDWEGVSTAFFEFAYTSLLDLIINKQDVYNRVFTVTTAGTKNIAHFNIVSYESMPITADIKADFNTGSNLADYSHLPTDADAGADPQSPDYVKQDDTNWFTAFHDVDEQLFTRTITVGNTTIGKGVDGRNIYTTIVELEYVLKDDTDSAEECDNLLTAITTTDIYSKEFRAYMTVFDGDEALYKEVDETDDEGTVVYTAYYLRVDAVTSMKLKTFAKLISKSLNFGHTLKKLPWWQKVLAIVIIVLIIIIAIIVTIATVGGTAGLAEMSVYAAIAAVASAIAITATVLTLALTLYLGVLNYYGYYDGGMFIGKAIVMFSRIAKYSGYIAAIFGAAALIDSGFQAITKNAAGELVRTSMTTAQITNIVTGWINAGANQYMAYVAAEEQAETDKLQAAADVGSQLLEDYTSPKSMSLAQVNFETYSFADMNETMDNMPYTLTEALIVDSTTKYY